MVFERILDMWKIDSPPPTHLLNSYMLMGRVQFYAGLIFACAVPAQH
jgi:hypothetical protein